MNCEMYYIVGKFRDDNVWWRKWMDADFSKKKFVNQ